MGGKHVDWAKWADLLGRQSDSSLARMIGCTPAAVAHQRRRRGVSAFGAKGRRGTDHGSLVVERARHQLGVVAHRCDDPLVAPIVKAVSWVLYGVGAPWRPPEVTDE